MAELFSGAFVENLWGDETVERGHAFALRGIYTQNWNSYRFNQEQRSSAARRKPFGARRFGHGTTSLSTARRGRVSLGEFRFGEVWRSRIDQTLTERDHYGFHLCLEEAATGCSRRLPRKDRTNDIHPQGVRDLAKWPAGSRRLFLVVQNGIGSAGGGVVQLSTYLDPILAYIFIDDKKSKDIRYATRR